MAVLLLRLAAPLQSWGGESRYETRLTRPEPTKSAVVGLLASALGRDREDDISDLAALRFGVRSDQVGQIMRDFHTASVWDGGKKKTTTVTDRMYLQDSVFVAGLESDDASFLQMLADALAAPAHALYLGRRSCVLSFPWFLGVQDGTLEEALMTLPWQASDWFQERMFWNSDSVDLKISYDVPMSRDTYVVNDAPVSFAPYRRAWRKRSVGTKFVTVSRDGNLTERAVGLLAGGQTAMPEVDFFSAIFNE